MQLWQKILIGLITGILTGVTFGERAAVLQPLGTLFINLILMIVIPLIFFVLVNSVASIRTVDNLKRLSLKAIIAFLGTAGLAVVLGIIVTSIFKPGVGVNFELVSSASSLSASASSGVSASSSVSGIVGGVDDIASSAAGNKITDLILSLLPANALKSIVEGNILHVILFAMFVGCILNRTRDNYPQLLKFVNETANLMINMMQVIIYLAPLGVFGYMAWAIGTQGIELLLSLSKLITCIIASCAIQYILFGLIIICVGRMSPWPFYRKMIAPQLLAFSTGSSKVTMPTLMQVMQNKLGVSKSNTNFLIPLSSALNMDGGAIYLGSCVIFFAQATGITLHAHDYLIVILTCTLGSIGAAGIPSGILLFLGMALTAVGLPLEAVAIIAGVDRLLDMITTMINVTGDACLTLVIDKTENTLDLGRYYQDEALVEQVINA